MIICCFQEKVNRIILVMKIIYDNQIFYAQSFGGISRYFYELARGLMNLRGFEAKVIAPFHSNEYLRELEAGFLRSNYFNVGVRGSRRIANIAGRIMMPAHYYYNSDTDIIHETYYSSISKGRARARVITVYDMIHELFAETPQFVNDKTTTKKKKDAINRVDHVICISQATRKDLIDVFDIEPEKISVVYLGHSLSNNGDSSIRQVPEGKPYLLYVGKRSGYKNFSNLLRAYAQSNELSKNFNLVAFGGGAFSELEMSEILNLRLEAKVIQVSGDDDCLASYYGNAAAFIYPSLYEGFGIPPLEAMNYGCPVVCSNTSSIPEVVGDAGCYFDPIAVDEMTEVIENVIFSNQLQYKLIENGKKRLKSFSWEKCAKETADIYCTLK